MNSVEIEKQDKKIQVLSNLSGETVESSGNKFIFGCGEVIITEKQAISIITLLSNIKFYTKISSINLQLPEVNIQDIDYDVSDSRTFQSDLEDALVLIKRFNTKFKDKKLQLILKSLNIDRLQQIVQHNSCQDFKKALEVFITKKKVVVKKKKTTKKVK